MHRPVFSILLAAAVLTVTLLLQTSSSSADEIRNKLIDPQAFRADVDRSLLLRSERRITEDQFAEMSKDPNTVVLDARSANRFAEMHIKGARSLPFTDFTAEALAKQIPSKQTRILIYCNNNVENSPIAFATKAPAASLNLSTFPALLSYGYNNVYELGPVVDPATTKIKFVGSKAGSI